VNFHHPNLFSRETTPESSTKVTICPVDQEERRVKRRTEPLGRARFHLEYQKEKMMKLTTTHLKSSLGILFILVLAACAPQPAPATPEAVDPAPTASPVEPAAADEVILVTGEWAPYTSETMEGYGAFTEIVSVVFEEMGVTPRYVFYPWERAENEVREGRAFAAFPYMLTEERQQEFDFSGPALMTSSVFFYMTEKYPDGLVYEELEDLQGYKVGGVLGNWYEAPFKDAGLTVDWVSAEEQNFEKLYQGRIDILSAETLVGWTTVRTMYPDAVDEFATAEKPLNESPLHLMVSRNYPGAEDLLGQFDAALQAVKDSGAYQDVLAKYGLGE
jgi:polar amino acid transport system substrate-binding protein